MSRGPASISTLRTSIRTAALASLTLSTASCVSLPPPPPALAAPSPEFSPNSFFQGETRGDGTLTIIGRRPRAVRVTSHGRVQADGTLVLSQSVEESGKPPRRRQWSIRQVSPRRYAGMLSDAGGPVTGEVSGNMLRLRFRVPGGLAAEQRLYLQADGRSALNRMKVRKLGVVVAVLSETIRKTSAPSPRAWSGVHRATRD